MKAKTFVSEALLDTLIARNKDNPGALLGVLEEAQNLHTNNYLPEETLSLISHKMNLPLSQVYSVATFYSYFNLHPQGDHSLIVCRGTACHTRGSKALLEEAGIQLGAQGAFEKGAASFTTPDHKFTLKTVACFGQCALSPVVSLDGCIHSKMNTTRLKKLISEIDSAGGNP